MTPADPPSATEPEVRPLADAEAERWTGYLVGHPEATLYHTLAWREVVREVFAHRPYYLIAERNGQVCGVLPLFLARFPLLGSKLISLPYDIGSGGPLASDLAAETALVRHAMQLARSLGVKYLELRSGGPRPACDALGLLRSEPVVISDMDLGEDERAVWSAVSADNRQSIRKAKNRGVTVRDAASEADVRAFYQVYLEAFLAFGTPPYGPRYFPTVWRRLHETGGVRLLLAEVEGQCVGGLVLYCWQKNLVSKFAACRASAVPLRAYPALYGAAIETALGLGARRLSWGTSARHQQGLIEFKERWGAKSRTAAIYHLPVRGSPPSIERYYDSEGLERKLWRKLPVGVTPLLGDWLSRWFC
jgi:hypothetical protein